MWPSSMAARMSWVSGKGSLGPLVTFGWRLSDWPGLLAHDQRLLWTQEARRTSRRTLPAPLSRQPLACAVKGGAFLQVKVLPRQLAVQPRSYGWTVPGDRGRQATPDRVLFGRASKSAGRNTREP